MLKADSLKLPETIAGWKLEAPPQIITRENIFDYLDGGGELYLAYKFNRLLVWRYRAEKESDEEILVEIYEMQHPDEAFGLLSLDWTGEPAILNPEVQPPAESPAAPAYTALYGEGLLRARVDNLYLRILASRESQGIKETILKLGKTIAVQASCLSSSRPDILKLIQPASDSRWQVKKDRTSYFHSHLILNSLYYLSHENILHLEPAGEALYMEWTTMATTPGKSARMVIINYPEGQKAEAALTEFLRAYVEERSENIAEAQLVLRENAIKVEDGWLGWKLSGHLLALVFAAPDQESTKEILQQIVWK
ncbi:MAG: hypothetical protein QHH44_08030 [Candidatus Saccharicenans sp.]|nr:hypothetical protein [Candidatus Saccharicenans sp.]